MHLASLLAGALEHNPDGLLQSSAGVRHDQLDPVETASLQRPPETGPEALVLAVTHVEAEDFPASVGSHAVRDDDGLGHDAVPDTGFAVGRVETRADLRHFRLGDSSVSAESFDEVVDFAGRDAVDVGLHHDREQRLIDAAAVLQQGGEERARTQLRDPQIEIPSGRRQGPGPGAVAVGVQVAGAFERGGTDERGCFRIDEFLIKGFGRDAYAVGDIGECVFSQQVEQGRLV
jgi:hypothetical protein